MEELWKPIPGYAGIYEVSSEGNVRSIDRFVNFWGGIRLIKGCILIAWTPPCGYKCVSLCREDKKKTQYIHRLVASVFVDGYGESLDVNHKDGNKLNNCANNLEWVSRSENIIHAIQKGLVTPRRGESSRQSKLKESDVLQIRALLDDGLDRRQIAKLFNVSPGLVSNIKHRRIWRHI